MNHEARDKAFTISEDVQSAIKSTPMVQRVSRQRFEGCHVSKNDTSPGCHVDGVGEALVFSLKTSHQLKTGGLVYRPVPRR